MEEAFWLVLQITISRWNVASTSESLSQRLQEEVLGFVEMWI